MNHTQTIIEDFKRFRRYLDEGGILPPGFFFHLGGLVMLVIIIDNTEYHYYLNRMTILSHELIWTLYRILTAPPDRYLIPTMSSETIQQLVAEVPHSNTAAPDDETVQSILDGMNQIPPELVTGRQWTKPIEQTPIDIGVYNCRSKVFRPIFNSLLIPFPYHVKTSTEQSVSDNLYRTINSFHSIKSFPLVTAAPGSELLHQIPEIYKILPVDLHTRGRMALASKWLRKYLYSSDIDPLTLPPPQLTVGFDPAVRLGPIELKLLGDGDFDFKHHPDHTNDTDSDEHPDQRHPGSNFIIQQLMNLSSGIIGQYLPPAQNNDEFNIRFLDNSDLDESDSDDSEDVDETVGESDDGGDSGDSIESGDGAGESDDEGDSEDVNNTENSDKSQDENKPADQTEVCKVNGALFKEDIFVVTVGSEFTDDETYNQQITYLTDGTVIQDQMKWYQSPPIRSFDTTINDTTYRDIARTPNHSLTSLGIILKYSTLTKLSPYIKRVPTRFETHEDGCVLAMWLWLLKSVYSGQLTAEVIIGQNYETASTIARYLRCSPYVLPNYVYFRHHIMINERIPLESRELSFGNYDINRHYQFELQPGITRTIGVTEEQQVYLKIRRFKEPYSVPSSPELRLNTIEQLIWYNRDTVVDKNLPLETILLVCHLDHPDPFIKVLKLAILISHYKPTTSFIKKQMRPILPTSYWFGRLLREAIKPRNYFGAIFVTGPDGSPDYTKIVGASSLDLADASQYSFVKPTDNIFYCVRVEPVGGLLEQFSINLYQFNIVRIIGFTMPSNGMLLKTLPYVQHQHVTPKTSLPGNSNLYFTEPPVIT